MNCVCRSLHAKLHGQMTNSKEGVGQHVRILQFLREDSFMSELHIDSFLANWERHLELYMLVSLFHLFGFLPFHNPRTLQCTQGNYLGLLIIIIYRNCVCF